MKLDLALLAFEKLSAFALLLTSLELILLQRLPLYRSAWSFARLQPALNKDLIQNLFVLKLLFSDLSFKLQQFFLAAIAIVILAGFGHFSLWGFVAGLFLLQGIRFKGCFNGGSDMMLMVLIIGNLLASSKTAWAPLALYFVSVHLCYSYLKAGFNKLKVKSWRDGTALGFFLTEYGKPSSALFWLKKHLAGSKSFSLTLSWVIIMAELFIVSIFLVPQFALWFFAGFMVFHFLNFYLFGLNRFFWAWLAAWPTLLGVCHELIARN